MKPEDPPSSTGSDRPAVEALLAEHLPRLRAYLRLRCGEQFRAKESTSDLVQSVCREILQHADRFQHGAELGFRLWLYATAQRKIADRLDYYLAAKRDRGREVGAGEDQGFLDCYRTSLTPSRHAMGVEELERFERAFDKLPSDEREVVLLHRLVGLTHVEVAKHLGRTPMATRSLLSRALARLTASLADPG